MNIREISDLTYILKNLNKPENKNLPKPIVFLGAGCSVTAGIPQAKDIVSEIIKEYSDKPSVKRLEELDKKNYYQLMSALSANERREIFQKYVNSENVKINLAHIYLAQLLHEGYIDYVFTPNFDDLLLKACSLFNFIPPVYDIANINDFTTTSFQKQSVTYLHGQHHGQWLLNAKGELEKVKPNLSSLFQRVCNQRPWIIIGYSGEDEIFDELQKFSSFDDELYWIGYKDNEPSKNVKGKLLDIEHKNTFLIQGYDADSFFLNLHSSLNLETPHILNKPFSFVKKMVNHIQNIDVENSTEENKEIYKAVKERYDDCNNMIDEAIDTIENNVDSILKQKIIEAILKEDYSNSEIFLQEVNKNSNNEAEREALSSLYHDFGYSLLVKAKKNDNETLYLDASEKYRISVQLYDKEYSSYNNWGNALSKLAMIKKDEGLFLDALEKYEIADKLNPNSSLIIENQGIILGHFAKLNKDENLFLKAFSKYKSASILDSTNSSIYKNWGIILGDFAIQKEDENIFLEAIEKFQISFDLNPENGLLLINWGIVLFNLAKLKNSISLYQETIEKYKLAFSLNQNNESIYGNWGIALSNLAQLKNDENLFLDSIEKYKKSYEINPNNDDILDNWSGSLLFLYSRNKIDELLQEALQKAQMAFELNPLKTYNLACCYVYLKNKTNALSYLKLTLKNDKISIIHILQDPDWELYKNDEDFINLLKQYEK